MDIKNIAIVRATNVIPFDGTVRPVSEVPYLQKERGTRFAFGIYDLLKKQGKLKEIDWSKPEEISEIDKINNEISKEYMPYNSNYNSMVLWSLNGLVPDDMNNTFSNKDCAIIDALEEQLVQSEIISLVPTDTAIKGNVKLSNQATILLRKEKYELLTQEEKHKLDELDLEIKIFEGDLKEAVDKTLQETGRYTSETLSLRREDKGYIHSDTSDELIETIDSIAKENEIVQELHWNVVMRQSDFLDRLDRVKDEYKNAGIITEFYKNTFLQYLFSKMKISDRVKADVMYMPDSDVYIEQLCDEIEGIGIDEYKKVVNNYNNTLEQLRENGKLPTPEQIVDSVRENKKIDLNYLIAEMEEKPQITMQALVRNALGDQNITSEDVKKVDEIERREERENTKEGVSLDD